MDTRKIGFPVRNAAQRFGFPTIFFTFSESVKPSNFTPCVALLGFLFVPKIVPQLKTPYKTEYANVYDQHLILKGTALEGLQLWHQKNILMCILLHIWLIIAKESVPLI